MQNDQMINKQIMTSLLSPEQEQLIEDGHRLLEWVKKQPPDGFSDYSFLVAPFAKAYEGFLKNLFLHLGLINKKQFNSDRFRVGKVLNPALRHKSWSVYRKLEDLGEKGQRIADRLWQAWKQGRNLIFHYFPHNLHRLSLAQAEERINAILSAIQEAELLIE